MVFRLDVYNVTLYAVFKWVFIFKTTSRSILIRMPSKFRGSIKWLWIPQQTQIIVNEFEKRGFPTLSSHLIILNCRQHAYTYLFVATVCQYLRLNNNQDKILIFEFVDLSMSVHSINGVWAITILMFVV